MSRRVLWLCNVPLPRIAEDAGLAAVNLGGWLEGMAGALRRTSDVHLTVAFPTYSPGTLISGSVDGIDYHAVPLPGSPFAYDENVESCFVDIIGMSNPDVVHIHGTEYPHSLAMVNAADKHGKLDRTVASIQGLASKIESSYFGFIPYTEYIRFGLRELIKKDSLIQKQKQFTAMARFEIQTIVRLRHVVGRTGWDRACTRQINPNLTYHHCNENLREEFYGSEWRIQDCTRHSVFTSQSYYPLKGFHLLLEAIPIVRKEFPDVRVFVAGATQPKREPSIKQRVMRKYWRVQYSEYIYDLIEQHRLGDCITFTGSLDASGMRDQFLNSHVFAMPSTIENSCNSLCEAMLLGVPSVASYVGGIMDLLEHRREGLLYQADAPYMLANGICEVFRNDELALEFSRSARSRALVTHDRKANAERLASIYETILGGGNA